MKLGQAVHTCGSAFHIFLARGIINFLAEHIIGAYMHEQSSPSGHGTRKDTNGTGIQAFGKRIIILCGLNVGESGAIHDNIHIFRIRHSLDGTL